MASLKSKLHTKSPKLKQESNPSLPSIPEEANFFVGMRVQKISNSGLFNNNRVICIDSKSLAYYSSVPIENSLTESEMARLTPKCSIPHESLMSVYVEQDAKYVLVLSVSGNYILKGTNSFTKKPIIMKFSFKSQKSFNICYHICQKIVQSKLSKAHDELKKDQYFSILHSY